MKLAVCVPPARCDIYGHLSHYAVMAAAWGAARGLAVDILRAEAADFLPQLLAKLADPDCVVHFHCFLYDTHTVSWTFGQRLVHAVDSSKAKTLATISDHPFTDFMQEMVRHAHPSTKFIVIDDTFPDEMQVINPALAQAQYQHVPFMPPTSYDPALARPFEQRDFDLVVPLYLVNLLERGFHKVRSQMEESWLTRAASETFEIMLNDQARNPLQVFETVISEQLGGASLHDIRISKPEVMPYILNMMSLVDSSVRQERRHKVLHALLREVGDLKVVVLGDPLPSLKVDRRVHFIGRQPTSTTTELLANTRAVLNCNPTYPGNLTERISVGMLYGSCVITDVNPCVRRLLPESDYIAYKPASALTIQDIFRSSDVAAVAARSAATARRLGSFSWDAHFDTVLNPILH